MIKGVLCGSNAAQEWMLPWWWERYSAHNQFPVTFCDMGMTESVRAWCQSRGNLVRVECPFQVASRDEVDPELADVWDACAIAPIWQVRQAWFQKPLALLQTPYERSLWLDLDCEVLGPLDPLFDLCTQLGVMRNFCSTDRIFLHPDNLYNGGVIVFDKDAPIVKRWAEESALVSDRFLGDDLLLSHLIHEMQLHIVELPPIYNWRVSQGINLNAVIVHWIGSGGKEYIRKFGGMKPRLDEFYRSIHCLP